MRDKFEAVEMPLKRTERIMNARQRVSFSAISCCPTGYWIGAKPAAIHFRVPVGSPAQLPGFVPAAGGPGFFCGLDAPRLIITIFSIFFDVAPSPILRSSLLLGRRSRRRRCRARGRLLALQNGQRRRRQRLVGALASSRLTCHIWVSVSRSLYEGMPDSRMPLATFQ